MHDPAADRHEVLRATITSTARPETALTEAAAGRTVARNARDRDDLADLLSYLGLPHSEDHIAELAPLLNPSADHSDAGAFMANTAPTNNAYVTVAASMLNDGTDTATVRQTLDLSEDEMAEALRQVGPPAHDTDGAVAADGTAPASQDGDQDLAQAAGNGRGATTDTSRAQEVSAMGEAEELLVWAEQYDAASQQIAAEVRSSLAGLARRRENSLVVRQAQERIAALEDELTRAREMLREAMEKASMAQTTPAVAMASGPPSRSKDEAAASSTDRKAIRRWAKAQGLPVGDRGALPKDVLAAYQAAHHGTALEKAS
ncbi:histone-like nucleoid-structuring protein Lsr2 [Streptomyces sp. NPDC057375]|uniref:Lsr2 family DNA-binding protein n=1 Tax=Streptomyces sp. NPDC057375 TaxID=3346109 RepID=UPI003631959B